MHTLLHTPSGGGGHNNINNQLFLSHTKMYKLAGPDGSFNMSVFITTLLPSEGYHNNICMYMLPWKYTQLIQEREIILSYQ